MSGVAKAVLGVGMSAGAGLLGAALVGTRDFRVRQHVIRMLATGARPVRVLHVSDAHFVAGQQAKADFISGLAELHPDFVVSTGDHVAFDSALDEFLVAYAPLLNIPGVFVFGSNDYFPPTLRNPLVYLLSERKRRLPQVAESDWRRVRDTFVSAGWVDLSRARWTTELNGVPFEFRGTDDAHLGWDDYSLVAGPPDVASSEGGVAVGVTHAPYTRVLDAFVADKLQLLIAGHTHGGQVCLPRLGAAEQHPLAGVTTVSPPVGRPLVTNCDLPPAMASGLFRYHDAWLHISAGLGTSPYAPLRLNCPPEACILDLMPMSEDAGQ
ncbi:MAG: metallophosphoesterase [Propionibacteriaceae bacterium]|nr:metallophosphoesterase [Propionibacteriaceae bacterium]